MSDAHPLAAPLAASLGQALGETIRIRALTPVAGGDIHRALQLQTDNASWFVKWNRADALPILQAERSGLDALAAHGGVATPRPLLADADADHAWLVMEFIPLAPTGDASALGRGLARLHRELGPAHGWDGDNFIGHTPQENRRTNDWADFWWRRRLAPQLDRAGSAGFAAALAPLRSPLERVCRELLRHAPPPSLLHGDLWGGNHGYAPGGEPVIFDPATYHGDRETDLAMMRLFGGFDPEVFTAYASAWPLPPDHERRLPLYQLYHVLNHLNLFGAAWLPRAEALAARLLPAPGRS